MSKVIINNYPVDFDAAINLMDDEIRETLSSSQDWACEQDFADAYAAAHAQKYGEDFVVA